MWLNMLTASKITNIIKLCQGMEGIITRAAELDAHKDFINGRNGIIDLRTGEVRPHDPDMLFMHLSDGGYVPGSQAEPFEKALEAIPEEIREWYQIRAGQAATGHTPDDDSLILEKGEGENGKTVVMMALIRALGSYARYISHRVLTATSEQHPTELMDLRGLRLAVLEETPEEGRLDPHRLKMTIGTPQITARLMRRDDVTFETSHSLFITSNYWPLVDTTDHGTWRRLKGMDWPTRYLKPGEEARNDNEKPGDRTLKPRVKTDPNLPDAALTWIIEGAIKWYANDQVMPPDPPLIAEATQEWRRHCDTGYQFAVDCLVGDDNRFITDGVMADALNSFLISHGKKPWSNTTINTRLNSSLIAAGIHVDKTPTQSARVRANDTESSSMGADDFGRRPHPPGKMLRMWRGVRFKTETERNAGHLSAVRTG
jgi:putative DNA primase/helicase